MPLVEGNLIEGMKNNMMEPLFVLRKHLNRVSKFLLISTDKAVRPTNIMGASKAETFVNLFKIQEEIQFFQL